MRDRRKARDVDADRRNASRVPYRCEVDFLVSGVNYTAMAEDLSLRGVFVAAEVFVPDGLTADLSLFLEGASDPIKIVGSVVRVARRRDERPGFAVEFGSLDEATLERIRTAIRDD
jgi:hypothetical protein